MKPRFLADADFRWSIVSGVKRREPGIDFQSAHSAKLEGLDDLQVLAVAAREGRLLGTMPRHFADFIRDNTSPGVFLIPQDLPTSAAVETLLLIWTASEAGEWENQLTYLPL